MEDNGAGAGNGQDGNGAPSGGSPEGGSENDDKPITAKQLKAALESQKRHYEGRLADQGAQFEAFKQGVGSHKQQEPEKKPTRFTRAQLSAAVEARQITQDQADETWASQIETDAIARATQAATAAVTGQTQKERIDSDLAKYKRLAPEILDKGSDVRQKIVTRFGRMVANGLPDALATELAAIEAELGPLDKLEKARNASRDVEHDEQGGGSGERPKGSSGKKLVDQLSTRQKAHYQKGIDSRRYKDWNEVEAELKYSPSRVGRA